MSSYLYGISLQQPFRATERGPGDFASLTAAIVILRPLDHRQE
jgi:hypothetical protein